MAFFSLFLIVYMACTDIKRISVCVFCESSFVKCLFVSKKVFLIFYLSVCLCVFLTEKLDEMLSSPKEPVVVMRQRPSDADSRAATVKQRPTSRRITQAEISVKYKHICISYCSCLFKMIS